MFELETDARASSRRTRHRLNAGDAEESRTTGEGGGERRGSDAVSGAAGGGGGGGDGDGRGRASGVSGVSGGRTGRGEINSSRVGASLANAEVDLEEVRVTDEPGARERFDSQSEGAEGGVTFYDSNSNAESGAGSDVARVSATGNDFRDRRRDDDIAGNGDSEGRNRRGGGGGTGSESGSGGGPSMRGWRSRGSRSSGGGSCCGDGGYGGASGSGSSGGGGSRAGGSGRGPGYRRVRSSRTNTVDDDDEEGEEEHEDEDIGGGEIHLDRTSSTDGALVPRMHSPGRTGRSGGGRGGGGRGPLGEGRRWVAYAEGRQGVHGGMFGYDEDEDDDDDMDISQDNRTARHKRRHQNRSYVENGGGGGSGLCAYHSDVYSAAGGRGSAGGKAIGNSNGGGGAGGGSGSGGAARGSRVASGEADCRVCAEAAKRARRKGTVGRNHDLSGSS